MVRMIDSADLDVAVRMTEAFIRRIANDPSTKYLWEEYAEKMRAQRRRLSIFRFLADFVDTSRHSWPKDKAYIESPGLWSSALCLQGPEGWKSFRKALRGERAARWPCQGERAWA